MRNKKWLRRMLYSHLAILCSFGAAIICITYAITYSDLVRDIKKSNGDYASRVVDSMTASLKNIERTLAEQIVKNQAVSDFFDDDRGDGTTSLTNYEASSEIAKLRNNPLIHSVYFFRSKDQVVLTGGYITGLSQFDDNCFIQNLLKNPPASRWSSLRTYSEFPLIDPPERIISMTQKIGTEGWIVLNVKADLLLAAADNLKNHSRGFMNISDEQGQLLYATGPGNSPSKLSIQFYSNYMGWTFSSGTADEHLLGQAAFLSLIPLTIIVLTLAVIVAVILYVTRRSYRPIEHMVTRVSSYRQELKTSGYDEFAILEQAFEDMLFRMDQIDLKEAENLQYKRKQFFNELQDYENVVPAEEWGNYLSLFDLPEHGSLIIAILEIDKYVPLMRQNRQNMLGSKQRLEKLAGERPDLQAQTVSQNWISADRLSLMMYVPPDPEHGPEGRDEPLQAVVRALERLRMSAESELAFTTTMGVGSPVPELPQIKKSFEEAMTALQYKMTAGSNRILLYPDISDGEKSVNPLYFKRVEDLVHHFRIQQPEWKNDFSRIFDLLENHLLKNEEMQLLFNYLTHRFAREMEDTSPAISEYWHTVTYPRMTEALKDMEETPVIRLLFSELLDQLYEQYNAMLESRSKDRLIYEVKKYIEEHFADFDLSLKSISDRFGINGKYASQLFKEEFKVKFVDFLIGLRVDQAQILLRETNESISEISRLVGYEHVISFGRIFKKTVGVSPGDYRKLMRNAESQANPVL
ncbi:helix-turn-helix domain-containing protein [Paenibacillus glycanilyticus]|uniref:helix-turn-helix domain-containing protein n=1 Tax=Paenibacillus glycanilyticus TaxID=126569 RepID=UPI002041E57E|nr:helix-turn-helix domain-containing protein [Paenibacillus glycanilyticus]MCM3630873.1 helix-turn-helix domain-containing protein [Paenibacillus glycanilyticus]